MKTYTVRLFIKSGTCLVFRSVGSSHAVATLCPSGYGYRGIFKVLTDGWEQAEADAFWEKVELEEGVPAGRSVGGAGGRL